MAMEPADEAGVVEMGVAGDDETLSLPPLCCCCCSGCLPGCFTFLPSLDLIRLLFLVSSSFIVAVIIGGGSVRGWIEVSFWIE